MSVNDVFTEFANAEGGAPRLKSGNHLLLFSRAFWKKTQKHNQALVLRFLVLESDTHRVGSFQEIAFFVQSEMADKAKAEFKELVKELVNSEDVEFIAQQMRGMLDPQNPARGLAIRCKGIDSTSRNGKAIIRFCWLHEAGQTPEVIAQRRAYIDGSDGTPTAAPAAVQATPVVPVSTGLPPGFTIPR